MRKWRAVPHWIPITTAEPSAARAAPLRTAGDGSPTAARIIADGSNNEVQPTARAAAAAINVAIGPPKISVAFFDNPSHSDAKLRYIRVRARCSAEATQRAKPAFATRPDSALSSAISARTAAWPPTWK